MMNSSTLQITTQAVSDATLLGDISTGVFRPLVPIQHREAVFQVLYSKHPPRVRVTHRLIAARFCWPQMAKAITLIARACLFTNTSTYNQQRYRYLTCFTHIHIDLVGPLPPSRSHSYLFTIIDRTSRWLEANPLSSITASDCARALLAGWVSRLGVPATITSDRGAQFTSALWAGLCSLLNIQAAEGHLTVPGRCRRLARPPPSGDAGHQGLLQGRQQIFTSEGSILFTTDPARPVRQLRRIAVAVLPQRPANHYDQPPTTADATKLSSSSIYTTRRAATGPLRSGPTGHCAAAAVADLRRPLPSAGAVNTFLFPRDRR
jgi:hypothetical protein